MKNLLIVGAVFICSAFGANAQDKELPLPTSEKFLANAVADTIAEIKFAETAIDRTENNEVKQLAQKIKDAHGLCLKKLMDQAAKDKLSVVEGLGKESKEVASRLAKLKGNSFDREYVEGLINRHEKAIASCKAQLKDGKAEEINSICRESLPMMKEHLKAARKVWAEIK